MKINTIFTQNWWAHVLVMKGWGFLIAIQNVVYDFVCSFFIIAQRRLPPWVLMNDCWRRLILNNLDLRELIRHLRVIFNPFELIGIWSSFKTLGKGRQRAQYNFSLMHLSLNWFIMRDSQIWIWSHIFHLWSLYCFSFILELFIRDNCLIYQILVCSIFSFVFKCGQHL